MDMMLDIETMGVTMKAAIVQIGAAYFNRVTGEVGDTIRINIDANTCVDYGFAVEPDTMYWWMQQGGKSVASILKPPLVNIASGLAYFNEFAKKADKVWCHATFDFPLIMVYYKKHGIYPNFRFTAARDIRTLTDLGNHDWDNLPEREGVEHDALDDCLFQIKYCMKCINSICGHKG